MLSYLVMERKKGLGKVERAKKNMIVLVMLGPPGSGKGTQASILSQDIGIPTLSTGQLLRNILENDSDSQLSQNIRHIIERGDLISDNLMTDLLIEKIKNPECSKGIILDGYPRNVAQAKILEQDILTKFICEKLYVLYFDLPDSEIVKRLTGRYSCADCKTQYHKIFRNPQSPGKCDVCGSENFSYRKDDNESSIKQRLEVYRVQTSQLIEYYSQLGNLIKINAMGSIDDITFQIKNSLQILDVDNSITFSNT